MAKYTAREIIATTLGLKNELAVFLSKKSL
jgi:hypothetical protein